jgi:hypothetical protein
VQIESWLEPLLCLPGAMNGMVQLAVETRILSPLQLAHLRQEIQMLVR